MWLKNSYYQLLTHDVHESVSDPPVHPAVDEGVDAGVRHHQDVHHREDVREAWVLHHLGEDQTKNLEQIYYTLIFNLRI